MPDEIARPTRRRTALIAALFGVPAIALSLLTASAVGEGSGQFSGGDITIGRLSADTTLSANVGLVRNDGPWPITLTGAIADDPVLVSFTTPLPGGGLAEHGEWFTTGDTFTLPGNGAEALVWIGLEPNAGEVVGFNELTVTYAGIFGIEHEMTSDPTMIGLPAGLPQEAVSIDGSDLSKGVYVSLVLATLAEGTAVDLAVVMGDGATIDDAESFADLQAGATREMGWIGRTPSRVAFFAIDSESALPEFEVTWQHLRWTLRQLP